VLRTADGAATSGSLYSTSAADTVVCIMHPREFMACHYLIPDIVGAGFAAWSQSPRSVGNDLRLEHEFALFDVAAGLKFLREAGFRNVVLLGNSGGSGLFSFYVQQSGLPGDQRIAKTPGGRPTNLATLDMPKVDGVIFVAPHPGQGALLMQCIDPSVSDEASPLSVDPSHLRLPQRLRRSPRAFSLLAGIRVALPVCASCAGAALGRDSPPTDF
jgi:hypothetical protein